MLCNSLKKLIDFCQESQIKSSPLDVMRLACSHCQSKEVCPASQMNEFDHAGATTFIPFIKPANK